MSSKAPAKDVAASVRARLLNYSRENREDFNFVLTRYGIERLLYRLSRSEVADRFVLKGAMLFALWTDLKHRTTRDVDLLSTGDPDLEQLARSDAEASSRESAKEIVAANRLDADVRKTPVT